MSRSPIPYSSPRAAGVAAVFGVSPKTCLAWNKRGIIHSYGIGHSKFYDWNEIKAVMARNRYLCGVRRSAARFTGWDIIETDQPSTGRPPC